MTTEPGDGGPIVAVADAGVAGGDGNRPGGAVDSAVLGLAGSAQSQALAQSQVVTESVTNIDSGKKPLGERRVPCMRFSRIVGYYQPVEQWNPGKVAEWNERVPFDISGPRYNMAGQ